LFEAGKISDDVRNEFVLISDVTGLSSLVDMIGSQHAATSSRVLSDKLDGFAVDPYFW
jgi:hydroxyquinol 1,2-dioxygenase